MSDALREMQDKADADFNYRSTHDEDGQALAEQPEGIETEQPSAEEPSSEPKTEQTPAEKLKPQPDKKVEPQKKEPKSSKFQAARDAAEVNEGLKQANKRLSEDNKQIKAQLAELNAKFEQRLKAEEAEKDPIEKLLKDGYKPEDAEKQAQQKELEGDIDGAVAARRIAEQMRERLNERAQVQQRQAQQHLIRGTPEFEAAWKANEIELVNIESRRARTDEDRHIIAQFPDHNSELGQAIQDFFKNDERGQYCAQNNAGIFFAFEVAKANIKLARRDNLIAKLQKELGRSTSLTSLGSSAPASVGGSNGHKRFEDMSTKEMGEYLRSKVKD